ncbi:[FeFe] hydrogenase H-cluster radical SAM maturase HydG [Chitinivibrio alkaliphilus]|uniref:Thiamine biosynthesis protein ThiH n=1 Tax=Chitinivibrio alkaliphilus ACht1 TaxID=1313304 RepID=U7D6C3_9BACT|nr:[FeFe] hydrogenase H-cluster radical SAM maturase HydG [Chitinivibrio alkaliphilus]ERP31488.1 thiamine biosynthesis protein ThiH [Chitinivibrio alkaliphilus ACht1]
MGRVKEWVDQVIRPEEISRYLESDGNDFIRDTEIEQTLRENASPDPAYIRDIIAKSKSLETLLPRETAALLNVTDPELIEEMKEAAMAIKRHVYDNRVVTFAPLYMSSTCVNNCTYCSFREENADTVRRVLRLDEVEREIQTLAGEIGHKRLIVVYGEHPDSDVSYIAETVKAIYGAKYPTRKGYGQIRRVNINAAPLSIADLSTLKDVGIGTYQVFQETYHHETYARVHPANTLKGNYAWRLYAMDRAMEAGIDDVGIGALFGLYNWKFEVMGLLAHTRHLEDRYGVGPHTISFPRLEPANNAPGIAESSPYHVTDHEFVRAVLALRLSVPYTGMILTAREDAALRDAVIPLGITQTDASTRIGLGAYAQKDTAQEAHRQQFILGDTRSLDEVVRALAKQGMITSFCTAGYRCGRTGEKIMDALKSGHEGQFCKLNAIITYREWLDDFGSEETRRIAEPIIKEEIREVKRKNPAMYKALISYYEKTKEGARDLYF